MANGLNGRLDRGRVNFKPQASPALGQHWRDIRPSQRSKLSIPFRLPACAKPSQGRPPRSYASDKTSAWTSQPASGRQIRIKESEKFEKNPKNWKKIQKLEKIQKKWKKSGKNRKKTEKVEKNLKNSKKIEKILKKSKKIRKNRKKSNKIRKNRVKSEKIE